MPSADVAARAAKGGQTGLRTVGSGNPCGGNAAKVLGARWGYAVIAADIAKGAAVRRVGRRLAGGAGEHVAGTAVVIGHCYPVWNSFRGGSGDGCGVGRASPPFPAYFPCRHECRGAHRRGSGAAAAMTATLVSSATWVAAAVVWSRRGWPNLWGPAPGPGLYPRRRRLERVMTKRFLDGRQR